MAKKDEPAPPLPRPRKTFSQLPTREVAAKPTDPDIFVGPYDDPDEVAARAQLSGSELQKEVAEAAVNFVMELPKSDLMYSDGLSTGKSLSSLLAGAQPQRRRDATIKAYEHYDRDDLLGGLIDCMVDFTSLGLNLQVTSPATGDDKEDELLELEEKIDELALDMDIDKIVEDLLRDNFVTDNMILYWRTDPANQEGTQVSAESSDGDEHVGIPGVYDISALSPSVVDWDNSLGQDILVCRIPALLINRIQRALERLTREQGVTMQDVIEQLEDEGIGKKWVEAVYNRKDVVRLSEEDGDHWIIQTRARKYHGLARPSMFRIFLPLESRRLLSEGDYSASLLMKNFLMLLKQGESITQGLQAGSTKNWMKKKDALELNNRFASVARSMRIAVNHTFSIEYSFPPKDIFDETKYVKIEKRIFNWAGVTATFYGGGGEDTYGSGFIGIKRMISKMAKSRERIKRMFRQFFKHPSVAPNLGLPDKHGIATTFDDNCLKEPKQILDEVKFLFESSITDQRTTARELGRDPDGLKLSKRRSRREEEKSQAWSPVGAQGTTSSVDKGGRPANPGTTQNEGTRTQAPASGS
jgi:hypothetical protein